MSEMEKQSFEDLVKAMTEEEMKVAVLHIDTDILWDELRSRETSNRNKIQQVKDLVGER